MPGVRQMPMKRDSRRPSSFDAATTRTVGSDYLAAKINEARQVLLGH